MLRLRPATEEEEEEEEARIEADGTGGRREDIRVVVGRPGRCVAARREYRLRCNWKVFADNYLDGGYHVPFAHPALVTDGVDEKVRDGLRRVRLRADGERRVCEIFRERFRARPRRCESRSSDQGAEGPGAGGRGEAKRR